ncbi:MAG: hypothetical protein ABIO55_12505 [Ginsengibacter sp.]
MTLKELFTTYFSQVTLLLLSIGYIVGTIVNYRSKKLEINHSLFQQNKILAVSNFMSNYAKTELMWSHIAIYEILSNNLKAKEIDGIIWPPLNEMKKSVLELKIYFNGEDHIAFEKILDGFLSVNEELSNLYSSSNKELELIHKSNKFHSFKETALKQNEDLLTKVCEEIRRIYKS